MLQFFQFIDFLAENKGKSQTFFACAAGPTDAVHIIFVILRQVIVKYNVYIVHINAPGSHVRCHQNLGFTLAESLHDPVSLLLLQVAVEPFSKIAPVLQLGSQLIHHPLGVAKNNGKVRIVHVQQPGEKLCLVLGPHIKIVLLNIFDGQLFFDHFDHLSIPLILVGNVQNGLGHGGGKEGRLPILRGVLQDGFDILPKAHVQHLIRLIQHHCVNPVHFDGVAAHMIHDSSRRAHNDLDTALQGTDLLVDVLAAVHRKQLDAVGVSGNLANFPGHLNGQLPGGTEDQRLQMLIRRVDLLQYRNGKGCRFTGAGLSLPDNIKAL